MTYVRTPARRREQSKRIKYLWHHTDTFANTHTDKANKKRARAYSQYYRRHPDEFEQKRQRMLKTYSTGKPGRKIAKKLHNAWVDPVKGANLIRGITRRLDTKWTHFMNKQEKKLFILLESMGYKYRWTGGGRGRVAGYIPDFMHRHFHWVIELYGSYWHSREGMPRRDRIRLYRIKKDGYKVLVIHERELKDTEKIKSKVIQFHRQSLGRV